MKITVILCNMIYLINFMNSMQPVCITENTQNWKLNKKKLTNIKLLLFFTDLSIIEWNNFYSITHSWQQPKLATPSLEPYSRLLCEKNRIWDTKPMQWHRWLFQLCPKLSIPFSNRNKNKTQTLEIVPFFQSFLNEISIQSEYFCVCLRYSNDYNWNTTKNVGAKEIRVELLRDRNINHWSSCKTKI